MNNKYVWTTGETVTADKMNRMASLAVENAKYSENALEFADGNNNIALAVTEQGDIITKNFDSSLLSNTTKIGSLKFPHYNTIGSPQPYVSQLDIDGVTVFDNVDAIYAAYDELVSSYPLAFRKNQDLGMDESNTYAIRHYTLGMINPKITSDRAGNNTNQWNDVTYPRRRILINGNIHGWSERWSCLGCYLMIKEILESKEPWAMFIKNNIVLEIIPELNPWGYNNQSSENVNGKNLNRTYFNEIQSENNCLINLVEDMIPKGLVGIIDFHNTGEGTHGYFVAKSTYSYWNYYAVLTSQLESIIHDLYKEVHGSDLLNFYHLWDATGNEGQLHQFADYKGLLGCTFEVDSNYGIPGSILSKTIGVNIINAFATYEGD